MFDCSGDEEGRIMKQLLKEVCREFAVFSVLVACIVLLWEDNLILFIVVSIEGVAALSLWHDRYDLIFFSVIAVLGSIAEVVFVFFGVWQYPNPTILGVPLWFPLAFGISGLVGERLVQTIDTIWEHTF